MATFYTITKEDIELTRKLVNGEIKFPKDVETKTRIARVITSRMRKVREVDSAAYDVLNKLHDELWDNIYY